MLLEFTRKYEVDHSRRVDMVGVAFSLSLTEPGTVLLSNEQSRLENWRTRAVSACVPSKPKEAAVRAEKWFRIFQDVIAFDRSAKLP